MTKIQQTVVTFVKEYCEGEDQARTATDIAMAMPTNHTIEFWVNKIMDAASSGLVSKTEFDEYYWANL
jgi:hypothetical protein